MADPKPNPKRQPKQGGVKAALTRKIGPLPFWAWAAIGGAALYWYRHRAGSTPAATTSAGLTTPADSGGSGTGDTGSGSGSGGGDSSAPGDTTTGAADTGILPGYSPFARLLAPTVGASPTATPGASPTAAQGGIDFTRPTPASDPNFAADASARSAAAIAAGATPRFGGVTGTQTLASGATLTSYETGRVVEQAPGKSAYVVAAGSTAAKTTAKTATPTPAKPTPKPTPVASKKPTAQVKKNTGKGTG